MVWIPRILLWKGLGFLGANDWDPKKQFNHWPIHVIPPSLHTFTPRNSHPKSLCHIRCSFDFCVDNIYHLIAQKWSEHPSLYLIFVGFSLLNPWIQAHKHTYKLITFKLSQSPSASKVKGKLSTQLPSSSHHDEMVCRLGPGWCPWFLWSNHPNYTPPLHILLVDDKWVQYTWVERLVFTPRIA